MTDPTEKPRAEHTPTPWTFETVKTSAGLCHKIGPFPWRDINKAAQRNHACIYVDVANGWIYRDELEANAKFIVRACNAHDSLVEAAREGLAVLQMLGTYKRPYVKEESEAVAKAKKLLRTAARGETEPETEEKADG